MKVMFVFSVERGPSLRTPVISFGGIPLGISYISAVLRHAGFSTDLVVLRSENQQASLSLMAEKMQTCRPSIVAFTCVSSQYPFIRRVAEMIKHQWPQVFLILGGPHVSLNAEDCARAPFDALCIGEGEYPMLDLAQKMSASAGVSGIPNLWLAKGDGGFERNPTRPFIQNLDELPFPDRDMWLPWIDASDCDPPSILLGRGCPYLCTYCCNHALRRLAEGKYVRTRSSSSIVREIEHVRTRYLNGRTYIYLEIETIGVSKNWTIELCEALRQHNATLSSPIRYHVNFRIDKKSLDPAIFRALASAGCCRINIGLESGSERVRREILRRDYSNEDFLTAVKMARDHGLEINLFNMVGIPGETPPDHMETVRLNRDVRPNLSYTSIFFPYPGTELHRVCEERGLLRERIDTRRERMRAALDLPEFPRRSVQRAYDLFDWRIHKGQWPMHVRMRKLLRLLIAKSPLLDRGFSLLLPLWRRIALAGLVNRSYGRND